MPKYTKMSLQKRDELTAKYLAELEAQAKDGNSEARRKLNIYSYIDNLGRSTRDQRFYFLSCERLLLMLKCPTEGHATESEIRGRKLCHQRYWCITCAEDAIEKQLRRWMKQIKMSLCCPTDCMYIDPMVLLSWPVPDPEAPINIDVFTKYVKQTFAAKLGFAGALANGWMLATNFNPLKNEYRGLYLGSSLDWSMICPPKSRRSTRSVVAKYKEHKATTSLVLPPKKGSKRPKNGLHATTDLVLLPKPGQGAGGGQSSPWQPKRVRSQYLLDGERNPVLAADKMFDRIRDGLQWVLGDPLDVFRMTPEQAFKIQRRYRSRRLTSTYGMVYGVSNSIGEPDILSILIDREEDDGTITVEEIDPVRLVGFVAEHEHVDDDAGAGIGDSRNLCSLCKLEKRLKLEEDRGYKPKRRSLH